MMGTATQDTGDDRRIGIKSTAILFGRQDRLIIGLLQILMLALLAGAGLLAGLGLFYWLGLVTAGLLFVYQQWLISEREPARCFRAFLNNNWFGMSVFIGIAIDYYLGAQI